MRIMAIDYGDAHTGIAISDPTGFLAGYTTVINAYRPEVVVDNIAALVKEYGVRSWCWATLLTWTAPGAPAAKRRRP